MEQFEKWFSADGSLIPEPGDAGYEGYVERQAAWRAALEWVLDIDSGFCSCGCMNVEKNNSTQEQIEKELQDEKC